MNPSTEIAYKPYYVEGLYMSADVSTGVLVNRSGRRMLALTNDFLIGLHIALEKECGDRVAEVLEHCGKKWGTNFGTALVDAWSEFYECAIDDFPIAFLQGLLVQEFRCNGWGNLTMDYSFYGIGVLSIALDGAIMSDIRPQGVAYPADTLTAGIFAGLFSRILGRPLGCVQSHSPSGESTESKFILADQSRMDAVRAAITQTGDHAKSIEMLR